MSRQDLPRDKRVNLGSTIVHVVNLSDSPFKAEVDGQPYILPPHTKRPVLRRVAEHWLGDPLAQDGNSSYERTWSYELIRLRNLYGIDDPTATHKKPKIDQFELIQSGKVYCPEFGSGHVSKLQDMTPQVRTALMGIPLEKDEFEAAIGSTPLSNAELQQFKMEAEDAIAKVQLMSSPDYIGYGVDDTLLQAMVNEL